MAESPSGSTDRERERVERRVGGWSEVVAAAAFFLGDERVDLEGEALDGDALEGEALEGEES